jgi:metallo-beta-lactamase family protein
MRPSESLKLTFAGAADTVTGSRTILQSRESTVLFDCGLFQGYKNFRLRNWAAFPVRPSEINAVLLSHAHLDHCGYLPALVRDGFHGNIFCTPGTADLLELLLMDSAHLMEEDANHANKFGYSKHHPAAPLYTSADVKRALRFVKAMNFHEPFTVRDLEINLIPAGHLLGAATIQARLNDHSIVYSGDIGRSIDLLMHEPEVPIEADTLIIESTYGNRLHSAENIGQRLATIVTDTVKRGGKVLLPSFAVGRSQALLIALYRLMNVGEIPNLPIFLDSPMASRATDIYQRHAREMRPERDEWEQIATKTHFVATAEESAKLVRSTFPSIIIAGSGMATGGRVLHHLKAMVADIRHHVVFPGFQVPGTRGAKIVSGESRVRLFGEEIEVHAQVSQLEAMSGHADAAELSRWVSRLHKHPRQTFIVHGERDASDALRLRLRDDLGLSAQTVEHMQTISLS